MSGGFASMLESMQADALRKLGVKVPSWQGLNLEIPASLNLQQCSGETAARYKASLIPEGARVADLTGGLGVDSWTISLRAEELWYNERDASLAAAVRRNFAVLGVKNAVFNSFDVAPDSAGWKDALAAFRPDVIYLDPARRDASGRKLFLLEDCSPDVVALTPMLLNLAPMVMVKVSPMADLTMLQRRLSGWLAELHVVGAEGECKELLCVCRQAASFTGVRLSEDGCVFSGARSVSSPVPSGFLFVPSPAMVKSRLGPAMGLLGYDAELAHFGKFYEVIENQPFASSVLRELGRRWPQAEVTAKGLPLSSEELRAKMRIKPGGPIHIFACDIDGGRRLLVCKHNSDN